MRARSGQAALELALVLPLLLLLVLGVVDFGRVFVASNALTQATLEGTRYASLNWNQFAATRSLVEKEAMRSGTTVADGQVAITFLDGGNQQQIGQESGGVYVPNNPCLARGGGAATCAVLPGDLVQVSVAVPFAAATYLIQDVLPPSFVIKSSSASVIEQ